MKSILDVRFGATYAARLIPSSNAASLFRTLPARAATGYARFMSAGYPEDCPPQLVRIGLALAERVAHLSYGGRKLLGYAKKSFSLLRGTQEIIYARPMSSEGQTRRLARSPLQQHADDPTVLPIDRATTGSGPYGFVQDDPERL